ncbi:MAG: bile acid:sodium symporter [Candidatus Buchananbacteria bacterium]|nr:bile acid:sodium symporter [Candidatus Buchananbacteria bacterium]
MIKLLTKLFQSYLFIVCLSLALGLALPEQTKIFSPHINLLLAAMFFFIAIEVNLKDVLTQLKTSIGIITLVNVIMLLIFPLTIYYAMKIIYPELAISFMLIAAMPTAMASALLAEIVGGKPSLALVLTVTTALLAPFTIPLVIKLTAATEVPTDFMGVFWSLVKIIMVPFALANIAKYFSGSWLKKIQPSFGQISLILLGLLMMGVVSKQAAVILGGLDGKILIYLIAVSLLFIGFQVFGYFIVFWRSHQDRVTVAICLTYMNITTAIYLSYEFFNQPHIVIPTILAVFPWNLTVIPFKHIMKKIKTATTPMADKTL